MSVDNSVGSSGGLNIILKELIDTLKTLTVAVNNILEKSVQDKKVIKSSNTENEVIKPTINNESFTNNNEIVNEQKEQIKQMRKKGRKRIYTDEEIRNKKNEYQRLWRQKQKELFK
jgi:Cu2+-containing amine oxidase